MHHKNYYDPIIVIIATSMQRTKLLVERSLRSVYEQSDVNPQAIYIVDDNQKNNPHDQYSGQYYDIAQQVKAFRRNFFSQKLQCPIQDIPTSLFHTAVIPNTRTCAHSGTGAWNTAALKALQFSKKNYLAILDDDDEWDTTYLRECLDRTHFQTTNSKQYVAAVITGILRKEPNQTIEMVVTSETFTIKNFLIGNPGFQGSNIFIRADVFFLIGCFDENMQSATDRDLAIRLIDYQKGSSTALFQFNPKCLVTHYVHTGQVTANPDKKRQGLTTFYHKYLSYMDQDVKAKSLERAKRLFNYEYPTEYL